MTQHGPLPAGQDEHASLDEHAGSRASLDGNSLEKEKEAVNAVLEELVKDFTHNVRRVNNINR